MVHAIVVTRRMRALTAYQPQFEDWLFHALLPFAAYATLAVSAYLALPIRARLYAVGASALLLLFTGIHNAWDTVTYHVFVKTK